MAGQGSATASGALQGGATGASIGTAILPGWGTAIGGAGGALLGGAAGYFGSQAASNAQKRAQRNAKNDLTAGYGKAAGYQDPIYNTALGQYTNLAGDYNAGKFATPHADAYQFDPQQVFQDPEYQAQMRAGTNAINTGAQGKGTLFSGVNDRDLTQFGQDLFANRSDALYNRGFNAQNTAFNQNLAGSGQNFNQGLALTNPLQGSAGRLSDLSASQGENLASTDLGMGVINANRINTQANALGQGATQLGNALPQFMELLGKGKGGGGAMTNLGDFNTGNGGLA